MIEDVIKDLTAAIKDQTAAMLDVKRMFEALQVVIPAPGNDKAEEPAPVPGVPGLDLAPAAVAEPAVLTAPAPAPVAPAPAAPAPVAPAPAPAPVAPAPAPAPVAPAPAPAPVAPAPVAPADPIPSNYKEAKALGLRMAAEGHSDVLKEFLASCGVKKLIDLPHDRYGDYYKWFKDRGLL